MNVTIHKVDGEPVVLKDIAQAAPVQAAGYFVTQPRGKAPTFWNNDEIASVEIEFDVGDQMAAAEQRSQVPRPEPKY